MWKKNDEIDQPNPTSQPIRPRAASSGTSSVLGDSIRIRGNLTGAEDLVIQGQIEGEVRLKNNNVTVGQNGRIRADIYGRSVTIDGEVQGNLFGEQEVIIRASGQVKGNIVSPRVTLENGSKFKGSIDMEPANAKQQTAPAEKTSTKKQTSSVSVRKSSDTLGATADAEKAAASHG